MNKSPLAILITILMAGFLLALGLLAIRPGTARAEDKAPPTKPMPSQDAAEASPEKTTSPDASQVSMSGPELQTEITLDPAFDIYIDLGLIAQAVTQLDPATLTDAALLLAEGEHVLQRSHRSGINADHLLRKAAILAAKQRDKATLDRLSRAAEKRGDKELLARLGETRTLAEASRTIDPALRVSIDEMSPETFALLKDLRHRVGLAELLNDPEEIKEVELRMGIGNPLPPVHKEALQRHVKQTREGLAKKRSATDIALTKLVAPSRDGLSYSQWTTQYSTPDGSATVSAQVVLNGATGSYYSADGTKLGDLGINGNPSVDTQAPENQFGQPGYIISGAWRFTSTNDTGTFRWNVLPGCSQFSGTWDSQTLGHGTWNGQRLDAPGGDNSSPDQGGGGPDTPDTGDPSAGPYNPGGAGPGNAATVDPSAGPDNSGGAVSPSVPPPLSQAEYERMKSYQQRLQTRPYRNFNPNSPRPRTRPYRNFNPNPPRPQTRPYRNFNPNYRRLRFNSRGVTDSAFDQHVDPLDIVASIDRLDAAGLTDAALQMKEAERVLQRPHHAGITADILLRKAATLAGERNDKETLKHIAKVAEKAGDKELMNHVQAAQKLASEPLGADPALHVSINEMTPEAYATYQQLINAVQSAKLLSDREALKAVETELTAATELSNSQKDAVRRLIEKAHKAIPAKPTPGDEALQKLQADSRGLRLPDWLPSTLPPSGIVDLKNSAGGQEVNRLLASLAQGNEGQGGLQSLSINVNTGEVSGSGYVRHHQAWDYTDPIFHTHQHQDVYDWTWNGSFSFNARTGSGHAVLDLGRGVQLDTRTIERLLRGDIGAAFEMIPNGGLTTKQLHNEYEEIRDSFYRRYGSDNVYFASPDFVNWACPETAGNWVLEALASGGTLAVAHAMAQAESHALQELRPIVAWMERKGLGEAETVARQLLSGQRVELPYLAVKWQTVGYFSRNVVAGTPIGPWIRSTHAAFVLIWKDQAGGEGGSPAAGGGPAGRGAGGEARISRLHIINRTGNTVTIQYEGQNCGTVGPFSQWTFNTPPMFFLVAPTAVSLYAYGGGETWGPFHVKGNYETYTWTLDPGSGGNASRRPPPIQRKSNFSFANRTRYNVSFSIGKQSYVLNRDMQGSYWTDMVNPVVRIRQFGGGYRDFTLANGGAYEFEINPKTGQIENYYRPQFRPIVGGFHPTFRPPLIR
jgi:hypothetical protein